MLSRTPWGEVVEARLRQYPAVVVIGSRGAGKTSLARLLVQDCEPPAEYLDLSLPANREHLADSWKYLRPFADRLVVLDGAEYMPEIFGALRGLVDESRHAARFLVLCTAQPSMFAANTASFAGCAAFVELPPIGVLEVDEGRCADAAIERLWVRGGYPASLLAASDAESVAWRLEFVRDYVERGLKRLRVRSQPAVMERFLTMLACWQGHLWNASDIGRSLDVEGAMASRHLEELIGAGLVRQIQPFESETNTRLVKSSKVYVRDSGVLHALLGLTERRAVVGHAAAAASFEGFVVEQTMNLLGPNFNAFFYRAHTGAELDLVLSPQPGRFIGVDIQISSAPQIERGLHEAIAEVGCKRTYVVVPSGKRRKEDGLEIVSVADFIQSVVEPLRRGER